MAVVVTALCPVAFDIRRLPIPLQKAVRAIRGNYLFRTTQDRDEWIEQELGLKISHQANGVVKVEFPSKDEYLLFVLKWA